MHKEVLVPDKVNVDQEEPSLADIHQSIGELRDLLTQAVSKISRRLDVLESHVKAVATLSSEEVEESVEALRSIIEETQQSPGGRQESSTAQSHIFPELQRQVVYLETQIARSTKDMKLRVDERHSQLKDKLDGQFKVIDRLFLDNQLYLNRLLFYVSILLIFAVIVGNAFTQGSVDRMSNYLVKQIRAVSAEVQDLGSQSTSANSGY